MYCAYIYIYIHTYICMYIYIYIHTHIQIRATLGDGPLPSESELLELAPNLTYYILMYEYYILSHPSPGCIYIYIYIYIYTFNIYIYIYMNIICKNSTIIYACIKLHYDIFHDITSCYNMLCYVMLSYTPNLPTNIVDFRGFDSSTILVLRGGTLMSVGNSPESLSQAMLGGCNVSREIGRT